MAQMSPPWVRPLQGSAFPPLQGGLVTARGEETAGFAEGFTAEPLVEKPGADALPRERLEWIIKVCKNRQNRLLTVCWNFASNKLELTAKMLRMLECACLLTHSPKH